MGRILLQTDSRYLLLTLLILLLTLGIKAWRWQILLTDDDGRPPLPPLFWALMLGQYVNLLLPVLRLGEIARIFAVSNQISVGKPRALGTLVVEKFMDLAFLGLTLLLAATAAITPAITDKPMEKTAVSIGLITAIGLFSLYAIALNPQPLIQLTRKTAAFLPRFGDKLVHIVESGLGGLGALTDRRLLLALLATTAVVAVLSVLTPFALFYAFDIPLGIVEAAWLHIIVTLALVPPSSPGKVVILDGAVIVVLKQYGISNEALLVSYALLFHLILVVPQLILGSIASAQSNWKWGKRTESA